MGLYERQPIHNAQPLYDIGLGVTVLIVGLGNVGKQYDGTRHNIGFAVLDYFAAKQEFPDWVVKKDLKAIVTGHTLGKTRVILMKPTTLMNLSGEAVQATQHFYKINNSKTLIVHDELDIDFGQIRTRIGGSPAGHNGIKSVIQHGGEATGRLRIGIGPKQPATNLPAGRQVDSTDFVLAKFTSDEKKHFDALNREINSILTEYIFGNGILNSETRNFLF